MRLTVEERKKIPVKCPICQKTFKNVYSMSAHKGFCSGANNTDHLKGHRCWRKGKNVLTDPRVSKKGLTEGDIFCENSKVRRDYVKKLLMDEGQGKFCEKCKITMWNEKAIVFELDHINGIRNDNRKENLRFLCPNCHSQTKSYRNKRGKGTKKVSDEDFVNALKSERSIWAALQSLGYGGGKMYERAYRLIEEYELELKLYGSEKRCLRPK